MIKSTRKALVDMHLNSEQSQLRKESRNARIRNLKLKEYVLLIHKVGKSLFGATSDETFQFVFRYDAFGKRCIGIANQERPVKDLYNHTWD